MMVISSGYLTGEMIWLDRIALAAATVVFSCFPASDIVSQEFA